MTFQQKQKIKEMLKKTDLPAMKITSILQKLEKLDPSLQLLFWALSSHIIKLSR